MPASEPTPTNEVAPTRLKNDRWEPPSHSARRAAAAVSVVVAFVAAIWFVSLIRSVILWIIIGAVLATALEPAVVWLTRRRVHRTLAAVLVSAVAIVVLVAVVAVVVTPLIIQGRQLIDNLPTYVNDITRPGSPLNFLDTQFHITERVRHPSTSDLTFLLGARQSVARVVATTLSILAASFSVFVIMVLLLVEGPRTWASFLSLLSEHEREPVTRVARSMQRAVGGYVRGNLLISLIAGTLAWVVMLILKVPYPVPLAVVVGVLDIVPLIGATFAAAVCVLVGFTQSVAVGVILLVYFLVYQQVENNIVQPVVYSRTVALSPLTVLVASLIGATVAGIVGVLLAIPLASAVVILVDELMKRRRAEHGVAHEPPASGEGLAIKPEPTREA